MEAEFTDTHCHIHFNNYPLNKDEVLQSASKAGVKRVICVGTTVSDSQVAVDFAAKHPNVWATAGVHPHGAENFLDSPTDQATLKKILNKLSIVAVGEIGLDYYKNYSSRASQQKALRLQIESGLTTGLPYVFHVREGWEDFWQIFDDYKNLKGVIHSFSSTPAHLEEALNRGLYIGLNGIMTFTGDEQQLAAAKMVPADKLLLETDAPFLTPAPDRNQKCEPKHIKIIADFLANLRGETLDNLASTTNQNATRLFKLEAQK